MQFLGRQSSARPQHNRHLNKPSVNNKQNMAALSKEQINQLIDLKNEAEDCVKQLDTIFHHMRRIDTKKAAHLKRLIGKLKTWCDT